MTDAVSGNGPRWTGARAGVPVLYYEDLEEGHEKWGGEIVVEREAIIAHAREFDPWPGVELTCVRDNRLTLNNDFSTPFFVPFLQVLVIQHGDTCTRPGPTRSVPRNGISHNSIPPFASIQRAMSLLSALSII